MADNTTLDSGSGGDTIATDEATYSGDTAKIQVVRFVHVSGSEGAKTVSEIVKAEDAAHTSGDFGIPFLGVRQDTAASLAGTDGDYTMPIFDSTGKLHVNVGNTVTVGLPSGASTAANQTTIIGHLDGVEGLLTTIDADTGTIAAAVYTEGDTDATITGIPILWEGTSNTLTTVSGADPMPIRVYGGSTAHGFAVSSNPVIIGGSASAAAPTSVSDGDAVRGWFLRNGALATVVTCAGALIGGDASNGLDVDVTRVSGTVTIAGAVTNAGTFVVQENGAALTALQIMDDWDNGASDGASVSGDVAHDTADAGEPVKLGAKAESGLSGITLVADGDRTNLYAGLDGVLIVRNHTNMEDVVSERTTNTDGASTAFASGLAAPGANICLRITAVTICNSSASFCTVDLRDGSAGSVLWTLPVPATGGVVQTFDPPLKLTANTALAFDASAATTTLTISANGFKSKV